MAIDRALALDLWKYIFGNVEWAIDCFGTWMHRDDYGIYDKGRYRPNGDGKMHYYGWDIDHIRPRSDFKIESDSDFINNYEPMHRSNNVDKFNHHTFTINNNQYQVVKCEICGQKGKPGYGIKDVRTGQRVDWKAKQNKCL